MKRRDFLRACAVGATALGSTAMLGCVSSSKRHARGGSHLAMSLDHDWLFGGKYQPDAEQATFNDSGFTRVTLPHSVTPLSWENWKPESWQDVWIYRRYFEIPTEMRPKRVFIDFDRVLTSCKVYFNGHVMPEHRGGYLPFSYEITDFIKDGDNVIAVQVDSRWQPVPPDGNPKGAQSVDYLQPGGITGGVKLRAVPLAYIKDVFAKPLNVLTPDRSLEIQCSLDAAWAHDKPAEIRAELLDKHHRRVASASLPLPMLQTGARECKLTLTKLGGVKLWDVDAPHLYHVRTTLLVDGQPVHHHGTRIGFREARFDVDGFFLNGKRVRLFGLDRHEIYPYVGFSMPSRVMRRDAEILRHEFNCNIVRCSHYPQTEAFLDACDELGLMVWEETPGWGYLGDDAWKEQVVQNVRDMIIRDRNHAAIIVWGVRVNESKNDPPLYTRTTELAKKLDGTRACSGSMTNLKARETGWNEDVFAMDDYHNAKDGSVGIYAPLPGVPYMLAETVGCFSYGKKGFQNKYRRAGDLELQTKQAIYHAEAHDRALGYERFCGAIAWCGFDYASLMNAYNAVKCPGVADVFRIPKLGATFYQSQVDPKIRPVIAPSFYWDFGPKSPRGPGKQAAIFSNCDQLEIFVGERHITGAQPNWRKFPHLAHAPFICDLDFDGSALPELRIEGFVNGRRVITKKFCADPKQDQFVCAADDPELKADGIDATRVVFKVADKYGNNRAFGGGTVAFEISGPGILVGDNPFALEDSGGVGAVWIKTVTGKRGGITVKAIHSTLGTKTVSIKST